jgi:ABC-type antimicrobial peptide transport system permease subunit
VLVLVIRQGMQPSFVGMGIGPVSAFALMRLLTTQLYEIKPTDPATFSIVALGLLFVLLVACYIPARQATKVDPLTSLRHD